jgi:2-polyprenyl-6-methoxyphenol hydroxylase-like FAD-dependent oxidoreductase
VFERGGARRFDAVIGADGLHSKVRELAFGPEAKFERYLGYVAAAFAVDGYRPRDEGVYVSYTTPGRQVARFAMRGDRTMFFFVVADRESSVFVPRNTDEYKAAYLSSHFGSCEWECAAILHALQARPDIYLDRVSQIRLPHWSKGRIALLGDAAFAPSLLAGQGAALAVTSAYVLAGELASAARPEEAFARYEQRLRGFIAGKQKSVYGLGRAFAPATRTGLRLRNLASRALNIRSIAKLAMRGSLRDSFSLPSYEGRQAPREAAPSARAT